MKSLIITLIVTIILFVAGFYTYSLFITITIPHAKTYSWNSFGMELHLKRTLIYCVALLIVPVITATFSYLFSLKKVKEKLTVAGIIIAGMFLVVMLRHLSLRIELSTLSEHVDGNTVSVYSLEHLQMEIYLIYGVILGSIVAFITNKTNKKKTTASNISFLQ